jgi:hypothetical protein
VAQATTPEALLVMLQGEDIEQIAEVVEAVGGRVTHTLPIIDAIGAELTRAQLNRVRAGGLAIRRIIDDLAWQPDPAPGGGQNCALAGAIELSWQGGEALWRLYNKGESGISLQSISLRWPEELGRILGASLDGHELGVANVAGQARTANWASLAHARLEGGSYGDLRLAFSGTPLLHRTQRSIELVARLSDTCETRLAPSYDHPEGDSYYPGVAGAAALHAYDIRGTGIGVAIIDSGLWETPEAIALNTRGRHRITGRYDATTGSEVAEAFDESGHGTHIASVLARSDTTERSGVQQPSFRGIAPDAELIVVKAFGSDGNAGFLDLVRGIQWVVERREALNIRILNLSFAARPRWPYWEDPVNQALLRALKAGIFVVAAAGNEGPEPMTIGSPGNLPYLLTVGAFTDSWTESTRDDYIPDFSSRGPTPLGHIKPDLVAPGGHMAGFTRPGSTLAREFPEYFLGSGEFVMTGSSQAAAVASGLAALMLQLEPGLSNDELKCLFITAANPAIEADGRLSYSPFVQGGGAIDVRRALTIGDRECAQQELDIDGELSGDDHFSGPAIFSETAPPQLPGQHTLIAEPKLPEGPSPTRRWGAAEHLERLEQANSDSPINWRAILDQERQKARRVSSGSP